jgi:hypothetical protein
LEESQEPDEVRSRNISRLARPYPKGFLFDLTVSVDGQGQPSVQRVQVVISNFEFRPVPSAGADVVQAGPHAFSILGLD